VVEKKKSHPPKRTRLLTSDFPSPKEDSVTDLGYALSTILMKSIAYNFILKFKIENLLENNLTEHVLFY
jgi:hypothetical protein